MTEEKAKQAGKIISDIIAEEKRLEGITMTMKDVLSEDNILSILYIIKENGDMFEPTLKKYVADVLGKAIGEKKAIIDRLKKKLEKL